MTEAGKPRALAVMVRYRTPVDASATLLSLQQALKHDPAIAAVYDFLLWDNSPEALAEPPAFAQYHHDAANGGIAAAFNAAAKRAADAGVEWLLLLDQDTSLPEGFLRQMIAVADMVEDRTEIAAIAPTVLVGDFVVSPRQMLLNRHVAYRAGESGIAPGEAAAINSATLMRVDDLLAIGGYSPAFWLDYSDWYVFHQLFRAGKKVWRAADITLQHSMTVMDYGNLMSEERYRNLLQAESAYLDLFRGRLEGTMQNARLVARWLKHVLKHRGRGFAGLTRDQLLYRLRVSRRRRLLDWETQADARMRRG